MSTDQPTEVMPTPEATGPGEPARFAPVTDRVTSTANTPTAGAVGSRAAGEDAGERGSLAVEDVVVEKAAVAAAGEVDGVGGTARRVLGVPTGSSGTDSDTAAARRPRVSARVTGQTVALEVRLTVPYPASVRATTEAVRAHVRDRVTALTELTVSRVDIDVAALTSHKTSTRRVVA